MANELTALRKALADIRTRDPNSDVARIVELMLPTFERVLEVPGLMREYQATVDRLMQELLAEKEGRS